APSSSSSPTLPEAAAASVSSPFPPPQPVVAAPKAAASAKSPVSATFPAKHRECIVVLSESGAHPSHSASSQTRHARNDFTTEPSRRGPPRSPPRSSVRAQALHDAVLVVPNELGVGLPQVIPQNRSAAHAVGLRAEEHTSELQSREKLVCGLL